MTLSDAFASEWNRLVGLYDANGSEAIQDRHLRHKRIANAFGKRAEWKKKRGLRRARALGEEVQLRCLAAVRFLSRLDAELPMRTVSLPIISKEEGETWAFLRRHCPAEPPLIVGFDALTAKLGIWRGCSKMVRDARDGEGLQRVEAWLRSMKSEADRSFVLHEQREMTALAKASPEDSGWPTNSSDSVVLGTEDAIAQTDAKVLYRIRVVQQFLAYVHRTGRLFPEDWNYSVAISPLPDDWKIQRPLDKDEMVSEWVEKLKGASLTPKERKRLGYLYDVLIQQDKPIDPTETIAVWEAIEAREFHESGRRKSFEGKKGQTIRKAFGRIRGKCGFQRLTVVNLRDLALAAGLYLGRIEDDSGH